MASYIARYVVSDDTYTFAYNPHDGVPGFQPGGTFSDGEAVPDGVWTAFASCLSTYPHGSISLILITSAPVRSFSSWPTAIPPSSGIFYAPINNRSTFTVEHIEDARSSSTMTMALLSAVLGSVFVSISTSSPSTQLVSSKSSRRRSGGGRDPPPISAAAGSIPTAVVDRMISRRNPEGLLRSFVVCHHQGGHGHVLLASLQHLLRSRSR